MDEPNTDVSDDPRELVDLPAQRAGALRAWRFRGALIIGASIVIGAMAASLIVAWRGGNDDEPIAQRTVATPTVATTVANATGPSWPVAPMELARTTLPSGEVVRFEEVQGADMSWCLTRGNVGQETSSCFGLGPARPTVTGPQFTGPPAGPGFFTILLPAGFASNVTVRDAEGALVPSARSSDGTVLLILDPAGRTNGPPTSRPARSFDLVAGDGAVAGRVTTPGYSATPGAPATDARIETAACLRAQGLAVPDLTTGPASVVPYPPQAAQAAWQACRDAYARASGVPASAMAQALVVPDCMAAQGWLIVVMSGPPTDIAAYNTAMQKCGVSSGSGPSYRAEVVACLRAQGLEVVEPSPGSASGVASPRYPPDAAQRAWQACRDTYARDAGIPTSALAQALLVPDCMAAQGWLIVVMSGPPTDASAFNTAMQKCR